MSWHFKDRLFMTSFNTQNNKFVCHSKVIIINLNAFVDITFGRDEFLMNKDTIRHQLD